MTTRIDMNCDMGESYGAWTMGNDAAVLQYVSSANIACGFHAGDPDVMLRTVRAAIEAGVAIGAHPGLPDLQGFGRRAMSMTPDEVYALVIYQVGALDAFARSQGGRLHHVKTHGALYNMTARDPALANAVARAVHDLDPALPIYVANAAIAQAARDFERAKGGSAMYQQIVQRMSQLIVGELTLDQTYKVLEDDVAKINEAVAVKK